MSDVSSLVDLFSWPQEVNPDTLNWSWSRLAQGDDLFSQLQQAVSSSIAVDWDRLDNMLDPWWEYAKRRISDDDGTRRWHLVKALVWCARQAAEHGDRYQTDIDAACFALAGTPRLIRDDPAWAWGCIRTLLQAPVLKQGVATVVYEQGKETGGLASLHVDILSPGTGQVYQHPADALITLPDALFVESMRTAWVVARQKARQTDPALPLYDARWRVVGKDKPLPSVSGRSASGMAALSWYHALHGTLLDEGVIVLAQVYGDGSLGWVDGISAKVRAVAASQSPHFDTIVAASADNCADARTELEMLGRLAPNLKDDSIVGPLWILRLTA